MKTRFAPEVKEVLEKAGWFEGRKVSEQEIQRWNEMRPLFPAAERALSEFAGLYVEARGLGKNGAYLDELDERGFFRLNPDFRESFCIDPVAAFRDYGHAETNDYEEAFGCQVRFIGFQGYDVSSSSSDTLHISCSDHLLMDERGRVFLVDYVNTLVGNTIEQALSNLILRTGMQWWDVENDVPLPHPGFRDDAN